MNNPNPVVYTQADVTVVIHPEEPAVVAYWFPDQDRPPWAPSVADACARQFPSARRFFDLDVMTRLYKLDPS